MITNTVNSEFGNYKVNLNHGYLVNSCYNLIESFKDVDDSDSWYSCPCCGLKPKVWAFDNGRYTGCGCATSMYKHFSVSAESIMSVHKRCDGNTSEYNSDQLRLNWNEYCATMINPCCDEDLRLEGKW